MTIQPEKLLTVSDEWLDLMYEVATVENRKAIERERHARRKLLIDQETTARIWLLGTHTEGDEDQDELFVPVRGYASAQQAGFATTRLNAKDEREMSRAARLHDWRILELPFVPLRAEDAAAEMTPAPATGDAATSRRKSVRACVDELEEMKRDLGKSYVDPYYRRMSDRLALLAENLRNTFIETGYW